MKESSEKKVALPNITNSLCFLRNTDWRFHNMSQENASEIQELFTEKFLQLPAEKQREVTNLFNGIHACTESSSDWLNPTVLTRKDNINSMIIGALEDTGVIYNTIDDSTQHLYTKEDWKKFTSEAIQALKDFKLSIKEKSKNSREIEVKKTGSYFLKFIEAIENEFERLGIMDNERNSGESFDWSNYDEYENTFPLWEFKDALFISALSSGSIGYFTLVALIKGLHDERRHARIGGRWG